MKHVPILWAALLIALFAGLSAGKGLVESGRKPSTKTYKLSDLGDLGVRVLTGTGAAESSKCPDGAEEITSYGCIQGHAKLWSSKLCSGTEDAWGSKCKKECNAWALEQGNRLLVPVAYQHRCYIPEGPVGNETAPNEKCPPSTFDKKGGKCKCWVCLVKVE